MDLQRISELFNPDTGGSTAIIGLGATGSATALEIAKLGVKDITLYDYDQIEAHNICNQQLYGPSDIGHYKVVVAAQQIEALTGYLPQYIIDKVDNKKDLSNLCIYLR